MTRPEALSEEREQLTDMIRLLGLELEGEPIKRERPDFMLRLRTGRTIGVELVRALDERIAAGRGTRFRIKKLVQAELASAAINAWVHVRLNEHTAGYLNTRPDLLRREITAIVELARRTMENKPEPRWHNFEWIDHEYEELVGRPRYRQRDTGDLQGTGIEHADAVDVHPWNEPIVTWSAFGGGQRPSIVQDAIDDKATDLSTYRQCGADEIWLLVIGSSGTGGALLVEEVEDRTFTSPYDRTVFLELYQGRCILLKMSPPPP